MPCFIGNSFVFTTKIINFNDFGEVSIADLKNDLKNQGIPVRL